jgi:DNA repair protein RAD50
MKKTTPEAVQNNKNEMLEWSTELARLQSFIPMEASKARLKDIEIPALEQQIKTQEAAIPDISTAAEEVCYILQTFRIPRRLRPRLQINSTASREN